jgi:hypothetical protein
MTVKDVADIRKKYWADEASQPRRSKRPVLKNLCISQQEIRFRADTTFCGYCHSLRRNLGNQIILALKIF